MKNLTLMVRGAARSANGMSFIAEEVAAAASSGGSRRDAIRFRPAFRPSMESPESLEFGILDGGEGVNKVHNLAGHVFMGDAPKPRCSLPAIEERLESIRSVLHSDESNDRTRRANKGRAIALLRNKVHKLEKDLGHWQRWQRMIEIRISEYESRQRHLEIKDRRNSRRINDLTLQSVQLEAMSKVLLNNYDKIKLEAYEGTFLLGMKQIALHLVEDIEQTMEPSAQGTQTTDQSSRIIDEQHVLERLDRIELALKKDKDLPLILSDPENKLDVASLIEFTRSAVRACAARGHGSTAMDHEYLKVAIEVVRGAYARKQTPRNRDIDLVQQLSEPILKLFQTKSSRK